MTRFSLGFTFIFFSIIEKGIHDYRGIKPIFVSELSVLLIHVASLDIY